MLLGTGPDGNPVAGRRVAVTGLGAAASASTKAHTTAKAATTVVVGNEGFTESEIMQHIYGDLLVSLGDNECAIGRSDEAAKAAP